MLPFISRLKKVDAKIEQIERSEISIITKSLEAGKIHDFGLKLSSVIWYCLGLSANQFSRMAEAKEISTNFST